MRFLKRIFNPRRIARIATSLWYRLVALVGWLFARLLGIGLLAIVAFAAYHWEFLFSNATRMAEFIIGSTGMIADPSVKPAEKRAQAILITVSTTATIALLGIVLTLVRIWQQERQTKTAEQGLITDRINKAVEQMGAEKDVKRQRHDSDGHPMLLLKEDGTPDHGQPLYEEATEPNIEVRLGAIYALERIAQDSERDHIPIMETLCAYVRENSNARKPEDYPEPDWESLPDDADEETRKKHQEERGRRFGVVVFGSGIARQWAQALPQPRADVQAAIRVIGRRSEGRRAYETRKDYQLDLRAANLQRCDLSGLAWDRTLLNGTRMEGANLSGARMEGADLGGARMEGADLRGARMEGADLGGARMEGADLRGARMEGADLSGARMEEAYLYRANLKSADLAFWTCARANASSADFTDAKNMTQEQVDSLYGNEETKLPTVAKDGEPLERTFLEE